MLSYLRKKMKTIMIIVAVLFAATMFYGLGYRGIKGMKEGPQKGSIATVNGKEIDHGRYQQILNRLFTQEKGRVKPEQAMTYQVMALEQVIDFTLLLNEAKRNFRVGRGELEQAIVQIMQANKIPDKGVLRNALKNSGMDMAVFEKTIREEILVSKMMNRIRSGVSITPDDLREVKASHILIVPKALDDKSVFEARVKAEEILQRIKKGESFAALAMKYSDDPVSGKNGGELGYFTTGRMIPEFERVVFSMKPGDMSDVVKTSYGFHIIRVEDTRLRKVKEKGKDINEQVLAEKQDTEYRKWLYTMRGKVKIEIIDPILRAHAMLLSGKLNEAVAAYNQASVDNPYNPYVHLFLGNAYDKAGNNELAMLEYRKATEYSGADPSLLMAVADQYMGMKKSSLALEQYRKASLIAGDAKEIHEELMSVFKKLGYSLDAAKEQTEINRIEKKEKFEKEIQEKMK